MNHPNFTPPFHSKKRKPQSRFPRAIAQPIQYRPNFFEKTVLVALLILGLSLAAFSQNLSGYWQGVAYQPVGGSTDCYPVTIYFVQNGNKLTGTSYTYVENTPYFAEMAVKGTVSGNSIDYEETKITDKFDAPGFEWCLGFGDLTFNPNTETIKGTLHGVTESGWPCEDAILEVYRLQILSPLTFCDPGQHTLTVQGQKVKWYADPDLKTQIGSGNSITRNFQTSTTLYVTQTTQFCSTPSPAAEVKVVISDLKIGTPTAVQPTCLAAGTLTLSASGGKAPYEYRLNTSAFQSAGSFLNLAPGIYTVAVQDANGCERATSVTLDAPKIPSVVADANPAECGQSNGMATALPSGTAPFAFVWSNGATTQTIDNLTVGNYSVTLTDAGGCSATAMIAVSSTGDSPKIQVAATPARCGDANGSLSAALAGGTEPFRFAWSNGTAEKDLSNLAPGAYQLTVTDAKGCSAVATAEVIGGQPLELGFSSDSLVIRTGETAVLKPATNRPDSLLQSFIWTPSAGLSCSDCPNPVASPTESTFYKVEVTDAHGCSASAEVEVVVEQSLETHVFIPSAFTPDDDGVNDRFEVFLSNGLRFGRMQVFDRWGELVFESENPSQGWDGKYRGKTLPMQVFTFVFSYVEERNKTEKRISGDVTVVR